MRGRYKLDVRSRGKGCQFQATSRKELDARDAANKASISAAVSSQTHVTAVGEPGDFNSKLEKLVRAVVSMQLAGTTCIPLYLALSAQYHLPTIRV